MKCPFYKGKTKADVLSFFKKRNIIDNYGNVKDYAAFHREVNRLSKLAHNRHGLSLEDKILLIEDGSNGKKYIPNTYMMERIDEAKINGWKMNNDNFWNSLNDGGTDIDPNKKC